MEYAIGDYLNASRELSWLLREPCLAKWRTPNFEEEASDLYTKARAMGEHLPFSTLAVYVAAFADILQERFKE